MASGVFYNLNDRVMFSVLLSYRTQGFPWAPFSGHNPRKQPTPSLTAQELKTAPSTDLQDILEEGELFGTGWRTGGQLQLGAAMVKVGTGNLVCASPALFCCNINLVPLRRSHLGKAPLALAVQKNQQMTSQLHRSFVRLLCWILGIVPFPKTTHNLKSLLHHLHDAHQPASPPLLLPRALLTGNGSPSSLLFCI